MGWCQTAMVATCVLGLAFLALEVREFAGLVAQGAGPTRSAFLSAFFTLDGFHGLPALAGLSPRENFHSRHRTEPAAELKRGHDRNPAPLFAQR
jgi:hypothetical protein